MEPTTQTEAEPTQTLIFYTTAGCHLCDHAAEMLAYLKQEQAIGVQEQDISASEELVARYGIRIPVVRNPNTESEIGWPFDLNQLRKLLLP